MNYGTYLALNRVRGLIMKNYILKTNKAVLLAASAMTMACASVASLASPIVDTWYYENNAIFSAAEFTDNGFGVYSGTTKHTDYELSWGYDVGEGGSFNPPFGRSAVTIGSGTLGTFTGGDPATGVVDTVFGDGPPAASEIGTGINISHWNNPISIFYDELLSGTLIDSLTLTPTTPGSSSTNFSQLVFNFLFQETDNYPNDNDECAGGTPEPCGDLFGLVGMPNFNPMFEYDGHYYMGSIFLTDTVGGAAPIGSLLNGECDALGLNHGCQGWLTTESDRTTFQFGFVIKHVPEPSSLALFGLGLAGLVLRRYKIMVA